MKNKKNKHFVSYYWRNDQEDEVHCRVPTKEDAWAFVLGKIRKTIRCFDSEEGNKPTIIDYDKVKNELFSNGYVEVVYCQCNSWWHNFYYQMVD